MKWLGVVFVAMLPLQAEEATNVVERWNMEFLSAVRRQAPPPCLVARNLAILDLAIWRAVDSAGEGNETAAAASAGHEVCTAFFAGDRAGFDDLIKEFPLATGAIANAARVEARQTLASREDDGSNTTIHYRPDLGAGVWERTTNNRPPELPHWGDVKPFLLESGGIFRPPPPPALASEAYARDVEEVRKLGGSTSVERIEDQVEIARFWSDFNYTSSPVGRWNEIAIDAVAGRAMTVREKARLFAVLNVVMADAGVAAWDCKYHYRVWRPVSAIHETFDDGNPSTIPDTQWDSLLPSPSHPDYVSGHSVFSAAAARVLTEILGVPDHEIVLTNRDMPEVTRNFSSYDGIAREAGRSRIFGGIHFSSANVQGANLGRTVADHVLANFDSKFTTEDSSSSE